MKLVKIIKFIIFASHDLIILKLELNWGRNRLNNLICREDDDDDDDDGRLMIMILLLLLLILSSSSSSILFKNFQNYMRVSCFSQPSCVFSQL
jgi:hypothetical protein